MTPIERNTSKEVRSLNKFLQYIAGVSFVAIVGAFLDLQLLKNNFAKAEEKIKNQNADIENIKSVICYMAVKDHQNNKLPDIIVKNCFK